MSESEIQKKPRGRPAKNKTQEIAAVESLKEISASPEAELPKETKKEAVKITSEEFSVVCDHDLNFIVGSVKFKKDIPVHFTATAFDQLCAKIPNLKLLLKRGNLKIV
jgi:hypothetical protein